MQHRTRFSLLTHRLSGIALGVAICGSVATSASRADAQAFPFPSTNIQAGNGRFITSTLTTHELRAQYARWTSLFLDKTCANNQIRVKYPESAAPDVVNDTRSEGIGYGMLISAYMGDLPTFQGLRNFYFGHTAGTGLMDWKWNNCTTRGNNGQGSAADADVDAAMSLLVANKQWPGMGFDTDANTLLNSIRTSLYSGTCPGILLAGTTFADCGCINASYVPVGYYPAFAAAQPGQAQTWNTARTNSYTYYNAINDNTTGLVPAWSGSNSAQTGGNCNPEVAGGGNKGQYQADAARTPWRVSVDYAWTANTGAQAFLKSIANFAKTLPIVHIVALYNLNGAPQQGVTNGMVDADGFRSTFVPGGFATAMTASSQEDLDSFTGAWQSLYLAGDTLPTAHAFNSSLALLYGLVVTGTMWDPNGSAPTRVTEPTINAQDGNLLQNGDFDEGFQGWSMANLNDPGTAGIRAEGYAVHKNGELEVRIPRASARPQDAFEVRLSQPMPVQMGKNYLISFRARASEPRPIRIGVELPDAPYTVFGQLGNRQDATPDAPVMLTTEMQKYEWVFTASGTSQASKFDIDVGNSAVGLVLDDVFFGETTQPPSQPGEGAGETPVTTPDPNNPGGTTTPGGGTTTPGGGNGTGTGSTPSGGGLGTIPNQGDATSSPSGNPATSSGGSAIPVNGALPNPPSGRVNGDGTCRTDADCTGVAGVKCSTKLWLCYDTQTGFVADPNNPMATTGWSLPPQQFDRDGDGKRTDDCGPGHYFWQLAGQGFGACYDPVSGYAFNELTNSWVFQGEQWKLGQVGSGGDDSGCSLSNGAGSDEPARHLPLGLGVALGAVATLGYRRRARR